MKRRRLGRTNLQVSEVGLGTVELGMAYGIPTEGPPPRVSEAEAGRLLNQALDLGINFIDTARAYGDSEEIIGRALKTRRREYILASKVSCGTQADQRSGALHARVTESVQQSLRALQTDAIDLMQLHSATANDIRQGELVGILQDLQKAGEIRFLGVTTYGEEAALAALDDSRYACIQIAYNLLDREAEESILPRAQEKDVGVVVRSVLLKGALTHRYRCLPSELGELRSAVEQLSALAEAAALSLPEFAYRFVLAHPAVGTALVGTAFVEELRAVVEYAARPPLSAEWQVRIRKAGLKDRRQLNPSTWPIA